MNYQGQFLEIESSLHTHRSKKGYPFSPSGFKSKLLLCCEVPVTGLKCCQSESAYKVHLSVVPKR